MCNHSWAQFPCHQAKEINPLATFADSTQATANNHLMRVSTFSSYLLIIQALDSMRLSHGYVPQVSKLIGLGV